MCPVDGAESLKPSYQLRLEASRAPIRFLGPTSLQSLGRRPGIGQGTDAAVPSPPSQMILRHTLGIPIVLTGFPAPTPRPIMPTIVSPRIIGCRISPGVWPIGVFGFVSFLLFLRNLFWLHCVGFCWLHCVGSCWLHCVGFCWLHCIGSCWLQCVGFRWLHWVGFCYSIRHGSFQGRGFRGQIHIVQRLLAWCSLWLCVTHLQASVASAFTDDTCVVLCRRSSLICLWLLSFGTWLGSLAQHVSILGARLRSSLIT